MSLCCHACNYHIPVHVATVLLSVVTYCQLTGGRIMKKLYSLGYTVSRIYKDCPHKGNAGIWCCGGSSEHLLANLVESSLLLE